MSSGQRWVQCLSGLGACLLSTACGPAEHPASAPALAPPAAPAVFVERARELGIGFEHFNGRSGERYMVEVLGAGAALLDYDGDGDLDLFLVQGGMLGPGKTPADALAPPARGNLPLRDRLYRNDLTALADGRLEPRFVEVTAAAGLDSVGYGMGAATGDYDNDGAVDLYVTRFGANQLWRNRGDGTFEDVTDRAGAGDERFSAPATFFDYDGDGWLDLFVGNYVDFTFDSHRICYSPASAPDYCGPSSYQAVPDKLLRNRGDGTFEDVTIASGVAVADGPALGVVAADLTRDGRPDLLVANDGQPNQLWVNLGDGRFADEAALAGCAVSGAGAAEAGMGVDAGDFDADGDEDLFVTHLVAETHALFVNQGDGTFADGRVSARLGAPSFPHTGFGTLWFDYDNDGWLDLLVANGAIKDIPALVERGDPYPLHEIDQLFRNRGDGTFEETTGQAGEALTLSEVGRGAAFGDLDQDGDTDVIVTNNSGPARLLENRIGNRLPWLALSLRAAGGGDALQAQVRVHRARGPVLLRRVHTDGSYLSASDPRLLVGLGEGGDSSPLAVEIRWPDGRKERWRRIAAGSYAVLGDR